MNGTLRGVVVATLLVLTAIPAIGGTTADPEIADPAGDANGFSYLVPGDTRPLSIDQVDMRGIWLETMFEARKVIDPATGRVTRIDNVATGLRIHVQTEAAWRPMPAQVRAARVFNGLLFGTGCKVTATADLDADSPSSDTIMLQAQPGCVDPETGTTLTSGLSVAAAGKVLTITIPFGAPGGVSKFAFDGQRVTPGYSTIGVAGVITYLVMEATGSTSSQIDRTAVGRSFTIGQDMPADVDCIAQPADPRCAG